ncbi:MAG TPA: hypothetical protein PLI19_00690 [Erysipelotrichaceae bacterium]|nr:hypothetical protein [Erysipelotrichaceae bacterium]
MIIEILYPSSCNLFGDRGNVLYLKRNLPEAAFIETGLNDEPYFVKNEVDLIYLGPMSEAMQMKVRDRLTPFKERIKHLIDSDVFFLLTGNAVEVFGKEVVDKDGSVFKGLGLLDINCQRDMFKRKNNLFKGKFEDIAVVGFQSQFTVTESREKGLFKKIYGLGLNLLSNYEGVRKNNLFATYLIGPILVLNPYFTKKLLSLLKVDKETLYLEDEVIKAYRMRVEDFDRVARKQRLS